MNEENTYKKITQNGSWERCVLLYIKLFNEHFYELSNEYKQAMIQKKLTKKEEKAYISKRLNAHIIEVGRLRTTEFYHSLSD